MFSVDEVSPVGWAECVLWVQKLELGGMKGLGQSPRGVELGADLPRFPPSLGRGRRWSPPGLSLCAQ